MQWLMQPMPPGKDLPKPRALCNQASRMDGYQYVHALYQDLNGKAFKGGSGAWKNSGNASAFVHLPSREQLVGHRLQGINGGMPIEPRRKSTDF